MMRSRRVFAGSATALFLAVSVPLFAFAQNDFSYFAGRLIEVLYYASLAVLSLTLLVFLWGLARFVGSGKSEEDIKKGKQLMIWGLTALFIMVSIGGIIWILAGFFGFSINPTLPEEGELSI